MNLPEIDVSLIITPKVIFTCDCGHHNRYTILGTSKPKKVVCDCGREFKTKQENKG
jgi:hypothetical protein